MGESDETYEVDLTRLLQTVRYVTGEDAIITNFSQFKLQMVSKSAKLFNSILRGYALTNVLTPEILTKL